MKSGQLRQYMASTISQLSVLVAGAAYVWFEPITLRLQEDPELGFTSDQVSWLICIVEASCIFSPVISGHLADKFGRKLVIQSVGPLSLVGWLVALTSRSMWALGTMRVLHGAAVGVAFTVQPIYTAEVAEPRLRGRLAGTFQTALYLGSLYIFSVGPYLGYRDFVYVSLPLPIVFSALFAFCPESPYFLLMADREEDAKRVLQYFRDTPDVEEELASMKAAVKEETAASNSWRTLFFDKGERKAFFIVQIVGIAKFLTGMPVVINYATETFSKSESFLPAAEMAIILGFLLTAIAVVSAFLSDWIGRKPLLLVSCFGCFVAHLFTAVYYYLHEKTSTDAAPYIWLMYLGMALYCFFSDIGLGPLLQTLQSEMFGASTRGLAGGITEGLAAVWAFMALKAYSPVNETFGVYLNFAFYSVVGLISGILLMVLMVETKGKTIGQMEMQTIKEPSSETTKF